MTRRRQNGATKNVKQEEARVARCIGWHLGDYRIENIDI